MRTYYEPMLCSGGAEEYAEPYFLRDNYVAQRKLDGCRYIISHDLDGTVRIYSRGKSKKDSLPVDKTRQFSHLAEEMQRTFPPGTVIDGEIVVMHPTKQTSSMEVTHISGASPEKALLYQQEHGFAKYACFDILTYNGTELLDTVWEDRQKYLIDILLGHRESASGKQDKAYLNKFHIFWLKYLPGEMGKRALYKAEVDAKREGIVLKDKRSTYHCGKRVGKKGGDPWVKVKHKIQVDVVFMGITAAEETTTKKSGETSASKYIGQAGAIRFGQFVPTANPDEVPGIGDVPGLFGSSDLPKGLRLRELGQTSGFDDETRRDVTANWEKYTAAGRVFTVEAQQRLESGALRSPQFICWRDDKTPSECIYRKEEA